MSMDRGGDAPPPAWFPAFLESIIASRPVLVFGAAAADLSLSYLSPSVTSILGYAPEEALGVPGWLPTHLHPEDHERILEWLAGRLDPGAAEEAQEFRILHVDGTYRWFQAVMRIEHGESGGPATVLGYAVDVTGRKQTEETLREAEAKYRSLVEQLPAVVYVAEFGKTGAWLYISPQIEPMLGYTPEEWHARPNPFTSCLHPEDRERILAEEERAHDLLQPHRFEYRMVARDGRTVWVHDVAVLVRPDAERPGFWQGVMLDITDRKRSEEELRETAQRLDDVTATAHDAIIEIDDQTRVTFWNEAAERLFGYPASEAVGGAIHSLIAPPEHREAFAKGFDAFRATGRGPVVGTVTEITALRRDGTRFPIELSISGLRRGRTWGAVGIVRDISQRKQAEEDLERTMDLLRRTDAERRRLLERLVRGEEEERRSLASDIYDGPLDKVTALGLHLSVLRKRCSEPAQLETIAQLEGTLEQAIGSLRHLVSELIPPALDRDGLAVALRAYLDEAAQEGGFEYHLENRLVEEPPAQIRTILYRISQEALNNVRKHAGATRVEVLLAPREDGFLVRIEDDGRGFLVQEADAAVTGAVGLAFMRERVKMAGGSLRVRSAPGDGTTVELWLPAGSSSEPAAPPA